MNPHLAFSVLQGQEQIDTAERELLARGLVPPTPPPPGIGRRVLRRLTPGSRDAPDRAPDPIKSWDVLRALEAIEATARPDEAVLDMGSVGCAILPALHRMGRHDLHGIDLDPQVVEMPYADAIEYVVGDMTRTPWPDGRFAAITSISVIEHGFAAEALLTEVARLLRPGGVFLFSTDYWPEKLDTSDIRLFDLSWRIFSADEIDAFVAAAAAHGLAPDGDHRAAIRAAGGKPIHFADREYTFLSGALVRG